MNTTQSLTAAAVAFVGAMLVPDSAAAQYAHPDPTEPAERPAVLDYEEGAPVPAGYRVETSSNKPMWATGASMLGGMYGISVVTGIIFREFCVFGPCEPDTRYDWMFLPVAGPVVTASLVGEHPGMVAFTAFQAATQTAGLALLIAGFASDRTRLVLHEEDPDGWQGRVELTPTASGARLEGTF